MYMPIYAMIECLKEMEKKPNTEVKLPASGGTVSQNDGNVAIPSDRESKIPSIHHGTCMCIYVYICTYLYVTGFAKTVPISTTIEIHFIP